MKNFDQELIPPHGGYRELKSYQTSTLIYDFTFDFCKRFVKDYKLKDQMVHAARSGRQNIAEGCQASGTSKKTEIKLVNVARASLEELLIDYQDFLRQRKLEIWGKEHETILKIRKLAWLSNRSYETYKSYLTEVDIAANTLICLIHQANFLLDQQIRSLAKNFLKEGGFTERLYKYRRQARDD
ncbi:MAG: four helix bundle suffix domain-containing protein [Patescibacteria group bacterium]